MVPEIRGALFSLVAVGAFAGADAAAQAMTPAADRPDKPASADPLGTAGSEQSNLSRAEGMVLLDYQVIRVPQEKSLDLMGLHVLTKLTESLYVGVGGYGPLFKGEYGGFMAFDVIAHAQRRVWGNLFADAGLSVGGGGGGKSMQQSRVLSGTGGFVKGYVGLGYDFTDFSVGTNVSRMKFKESVIDNTQLNVFVQVPFSYSIGSYASSGEKLAAADAKGLFRGPSETTLTLGLDNFVQIDPEGSNTATIRLIDLQFAHYMTRSTYWYASVGIGYHGLPLYNQIIGGLGYRFSVSPRVNLHGQLGVGSGGWAPETINTGSGLLIYPKAAAEYSIAKNLSLSLSAGYLFAPQGSSKNYTFGASLNYHFGSGRDRSDARDTFDSASYRGYRIGVYPQTGFNVRRRDIDRESINMLSVQFDSIVSDHVYIPIKGSAAYTAYLGYPGYGELLAGVGVQSKYNKADRVQYFGQLLGGANVHGTILQAGIGMNFGLNDRLAIYASAGKTLTTSSSDGSFRSDYVGLGMTYRFSVPN